MIEVRSTTKTVRTLHVDISEDAANTLVRGFGYYLQIPYTNSPFPKEQVFHELLAKLNVELRKPVQP